MNDGLTALNNIIDNRYESYNILKRKYGIVKEVLSYARAIVTVEDEDMMDLQREYQKPKDDDEEETDYGAKTRDLNLLNKTGEELFVGDSVWIYYWKTLTDGYIALHVGAKKEVSVPVRYMAVIKEEHTNAKIYSESEREQLIFDRTWVIDEKDLIAAQWQNSRESTQFNMFLVTGFPAIPIGNAGTSYSISSFFNSMGQMSDAARRVLHNELIRINPIYCTQRILLDVAELEVYNMYTSKTINYNGKIEIAVKPYEIISGKYQPRPYVKYINEGEGYWNMLYPLNVLPDSYIPLYDDPQEAVKKCTMAIVSDGSLIDTLNTRLRLAIAVHYESGWFLIGTDAGVWWYQTIDSRFLNEDEMNYALCVIGR